MNLSFSSQITKDSVFDTVEDHLRSEYLKITAQDRSRPWGGFFVIDEKLAQKFINIYFPFLNTKELLPGNKLSPKILIVASQKRLSWQYHHRRAEVWKLIGGRVGVMRSETDQEKDITYLMPGDIVQLKQGERHRLIGLDEWGIVAEIWQHTDRQHPSDEEDIVRVQDDFGR
jgi:mannose-6-phosphate isomerase